MKKSLVFAICWSFYLLCIYIMGIFGVESSWFFALFPTTVMVYAEWERIFLKKK